LRRLAAAIVAPENPRVNCAVRLDSPLPTNSNWRRARGPATRQLRCDGRTHVTELISKDGVVLNTWAEPLDALDWLARQQTNWIGYLSYDLGRLFERFPTRAHDDLHLPLFVFTEHPAGTASESPRAAHRLQSQPLHSNFTRPAYLDAVARVIEYIRAGDSFQVNLSQRFTAGLPAQPNEIYQRLLDRSPAWYGAYLDYGDHALICNSPELFLRVAPQPDGCRTVTTRPIKGTRPRQPGRDLELRQSAKDQAELNMIIDLERNDLGRVCEIGSIKVTQPRTIEAHPTVYHGVATIEGTLRPEVTFVDLFRATFPGGSVTGAPKIRAIEIIEELEPTCRGPYCGAIGYLSADGHIEFNIAIRTMIVKDGLVHIPVGGGIVADSNPADEYEETLVKARAMFDALGISTTYLHKNCAI
jgi:anthranilate/para-aminobenzoate synthase component I